MPPTRQTARRLGAALLLGAPPLAAQDAALVFRVGADTMFVERVTRRDGALLGEITAVGNARVRYTWDRDTLAIVAWRPNAPADAPPFQRVWIHVRRDSFVAAVITDGVEQVQRGPARAGAVPVLNQSVELFGEAIRRARRPGADSVTVPVLLAQGGQVVDVVARFVTADSAVVHVASQVQHYVVDADGLVIRVYAPAQRARVDRVSGPAASRVALGAPSYGAPAGAPYTAEEVRIPAGTHALAATFTRPATAREQMAAVITISGSGAQDRDGYIPGVAGYRPFRQLADSLARRGIATLRFDDRGYGGSGGSFAGSTTADFADDVRAAVAYLRARPDVDPARIFLVGHSEGGIIAPLVAADDPALAGIVLLAGTGRRGREIVYFQQRQAIAADSAFRTPAARDSAARAARWQFDSLIVPRDPWVRFFADHDPLPVARRVRSPVLVLHGDTDTQVTVADARALAAAVRAGGNRDVTLRILPGLNHLFVRDADGSFVRYAQLTDVRVAPEAVGAIVDWVVARATRR